MDNFSSSLLTNELSLFLVIWQRHGIGQNELFCLLPADHLERDARPLWATVPGKRETMGETALQDFCRDYEWGTGGG